ncbi:MULTISPECIES: S66 peptidase family protein [unclassified Enterococcus]|uniref:S66 family peptidase n=1 Tax=unclassified Enterococcus TaxID=2608891 RepID=UPI001557180E|nr:MULTISPECIES: S66 peptidase family protein [unclassified Enterococcus]MBS7576065.1 LD-carboxypeptidase [Enterococcus sp. MMGLQ5-2]MBS7583298.1 LD-carboxypeptidase [Enterococcus sp. MMGLQ5-1]NPD11158.1 LD-carboxypeptidase [Enterococcus sp. MMGLQ5-1]NPD35901.1 LD-carboxypeptidase [Enterococcus sp. MMGLQ5-2]
MEKIFPSKLRIGDEIRIISPSSSIESVGGFNDNISAQKYLEKMGFKISFGSNILENDQLFSSSIQARLDDLHQAFMDKNVKAIMTTTGGFNSNELLPHINWQIIQNNPKIFVGYSDITSLHNAIRARTGLVTYYGPAYASFKMKELQKYQSTAWLKAVTSTSFSLTPSEYWSSDAWYDSTVDRIFLPNNWQVYSEGKVEGEVTGGNIQTYCLQAGTIYFPKVKNPIIFIEQSEGGTILEFSRELSQILQIHSDLSGLVIGRFPKANEMTTDTLIIILNKFPALKFIPVIHDVDFGHTQPIFTFPLGGKVKINTENKEIKILEG